MAQPNTLNPQPDSATAVEAIAKLAQKAHDAQVLLVKTDGLGPGLPSEIPVLYDPHNGRVSTLKSEIEAYRQDPASRTGSAVALTLQSFIDLVKRHADDGSVVFAETRWPNPKLTAVLDYHALDKSPRFLRHRVGYAFPITEELKAWQAQNGKAMTQADFASFLEEHAAELSSPFDGEVQEFEGLFREKFGTPSEILTLSRELEVYVGQSVKNKQRLQTGEQAITFVEEHTNGRGEQIVVPGIFMVSVPAFVDGEAVRIPARLRYRVTGGQIVWFYQLYRWEFFLREQVQADLKTVADATGLPTYEGAPENNGERGL